ncbi:MAG: hypothetical protein IJ266_02475, partial [Elusimicrobiaceae bacterium]|nr:hypothetical protein [Elusimicrobiaceae bacterium]
MQIIKNWIAKTYAKQLLYLLGLMILFGGLGVLMGQDCNFDLMNYHLYNGYAFLFRSATTDIMPAGIHTFFIPWLDVPYYLIFRWGMNWPHVAAFFQSVIYGVYAFILMHVCQLCLPHTDKTNRYDWLFAWSVGVFGAMGISQINLSSGEIYEAVLLIGAVWAALYAYKVSATARWLLVSIVLAALAFALKYTSAPFCVGVGAMVLYYWKVRHLPYRTLRLYIATGALVIILLDGWFWYKYWINFHNPLFPFFNEWFKSPYFEPVNLIDKRFFPTNFFTRIFLPLFWVHTTVEMGAEVLFVDCRWACGFISFWALVSKWGYDAWHKKYPSALQMGVIIFAGVGYLIWLKLFIILRYAVVLEGMLGVLIVWALQSWLSARWKNIVLVGLVVLFGCSTMYPDWGKDAFAEKSLVLENFEDVPDHSLVLVQTQGLSYVLPFFNQ